MENKQKFSERFWNFCAKPFRKFESKHPEFYKKHRDLIGSMVCGVVGSIITYVLCAFMPYVFGQYFAEIEWAFPSIKMHYKNIEYAWSIIGFGVRIRDGVAIIGGGLGYSISFYLAQILTHLFSFLFLRRFHHSKQNPYKTYFIGLSFCLFTCILGNMVNGLWLPIFNAELTFLEYNLIVLLVVGTINFIIGHIQNLILYKNESKLNKSLDEREAKRNRKREMKLKKEAEKYAKASGINIKTDEDLESVIDTKENIEVAEEATEEIEEETASVENIEESSKEITEENVSEEIIEKKEPTDE